MDNVFYDGTKILSLKDINGNKPEIYLVTGTRTAGKTTYFNRLVFNRFVKKKEKFIVLVRFSYQMDDIEDKFFKDIRELFFPWFTMTSEPMVGGKFRELFVQPNDQEELKEACGYAIAINDAGLVKEYSHLFTDASCFVFDEFQSVDNKYCHDEVKKFRSIHTSIARGKGKQVRYVPVYMMSNAVSVLNPYFAGLGISKRLDDKTKYLKGNGFVLEVTNNENAKQAIKSSAFNTAWEDQTVTEHEAENVYLNDNSSFVEKMIGNSRYLCTLKYNNKEFAIRMYEDEGIIYCDNRADLTFPTKFCVTTADHGINYVMLKNNDFFFAKLRYFFKMGCFRFRDLSCKEAIIDTLAYK
ncbi:MAG: phage DNA encapsidation protein [Cellulosilyticum sp.]|nr:phage DNA encapsidation protein [Cellulosilyticum sp.]